MNHEQQSKPPETPTEEVPVYEIPEEDALTTPDQALRELEETETATPSTSPETTSDEMPIHEVPDEHTQITPQQALEELEKAGEEKI